MDYSHDHRHSDRNNHRNPNRQEREGHRQPRSMVRGPSADMSHLFKKPTQMKTDEEQSVQMKAGEEQSVQMKKPSHEGGLPEDLQSNMQQAFGQSFSDVTIHRDSTKATEMGAQAYTQGKDVHFAPGRYNPSSNEGKELIGHELTHVVQQKQGRVQATTQAKGLPVNDDQGLETEADIMGRKAAKGEEVGKVGVSSEKGIQQSALPPDKINEYFQKYETFAQRQLDHWYLKSPMQSGEKLTGAMFARAARKVYDEKKDLNAVVPVEFALSQSLLEGGVKGKERTKGNVFNVGAFDSGKTSTEKSINSHEKGFDAYYKLMSDKFLSSKNPDDLLVNGNFTTKSGGVYATNPFYEIEIKAEIGGMHFRNSQYALSASVGVGKPNSPKDVEFIGGMLATLGYLSKDKIQDVSAVCSAILVFQKKEIAPENEEWFKKRMKLVTNSKDQENMKLKGKNFTDGVVGKSGVTVGLLYFQTYLNGKIPTLVPTSLSGESEKSEATKTHPAFINKVVTSETPTSLSIVPVTERQDPSLMYLVQEGDSPSILAKIFGVPLEELKALNADKWKVWSKTSQGFNAGEKVFIPGALPETIATIQAERRKAVLDKREAERLANQKKQKEGNKNGIANSPENFIAKKWEEYSRNYISMLALGKSLMPYAGTHASEIIKIINKLRSIERDNLCYVLAASSSDAALRGFDKGLLNRMAGELSKFANTRSWIENWTQEKRVLAAMGPAVEKQEQKKNAVTKMPDPKGKTDAELRVEAALSAVNDPNEQRRYSQNYEEKVAGKKVDCSMFMREVDEKTAGSKDKMFFSNKRFNAEEGKGTQIMAKILKKYGTYTTVLTDIQVGDYVFFGEGTSKDIDSISHIGMVYSKESDGSFKYAHASVRKATNLKDGKGTYKDGNKSINNTGSISNKGLWYDNMYFKGGGRP